MTRAGRIRTSVRGPLQLTKCPMSACNYRNPVAGVPATVPSRRICHQDPHFCDDHDQRLALPDTENQDGAMAKATNRLDGSDVGG